MMIMITPHETLLLIYLHIEKGDLGDIDGAMVDLLRVVHVQINQVGRILQIIALFHNANDLEYTTDSMFYEDCQH